jgi:hypothetical protein
MSAGGGGRIVGSRNRFSSSSLRQPAPPIMNKGRFGLELGWNFVNFDIS